MKYRSISFLFKGRILLFSVIIAVMAMSCSVRIGEQAVKTLPELDSARTYIMSQKVFTFGDRFVIKDENRNQVFFIKGKAISIGDRLSFFDNNNNRLAYIKEMIPSFRSYYKIYREGKIYARVHRVINLFKEKFIIEVPGSDYYKVVGNFWKHEFKFIHNDRLVARVSKKFFSVGDKYRIRIARDEDEVLILATVAIIDMVCHDDLG